MMRPGHEIHWIAFDAVGTLIHANPPVVAVYHRIGNQHGSRLTLPEVARRFREAFGSRVGDADLSSSEAAEREFWRTIVGQVLDDVTDPAACFEELHAWFAAPSAWRCFDDVAPALETLHERGYGLAMASNFDERLHAVRKGLPELMPIDACVISSEVGWRKPHAGFFAALTKACGCQPEQILMVGDDLTNDVHGAEQAGLPAVLLDRHGAPVGNTHDGHAIQSLVELNDCVSSLEPRLSAPKK